MTPGFKTALVIPALNEEAVIGRTLREVPAGLYCTIIVADNGSSDKTAEIARAAGAVVVREEERGYGAACLKAIHELPDDIQAVVFMQSDLSEAPGEAARLISPIHDGCADLVLGSRTLGKAAPGALLPHQAFGNWLATRLIRLFYGFEYTDLGPYRAIRRIALERLNMRERGYGWTIEMQIRAIEENLRILEVPVSYGIRVAGRNKVSGSVSASLQAGFRIIATVFRLRFSRRAGAR
jgi:glycosyltransferase involved in cell wall biosynthesis